MKGRKRHLLVDTQGLVLMAEVHSANIQDLKRASSSCFNPRKAASPASHTCGWTPATPAKTRALGGWRKR